MKHFLVVFATIMFFVWNGWAIACHNHGGECQVKEWRSIHNNLLEHLTIEGMTTCEMGSVGVRIYDTSGDKPKFLGIGSTLFMGHTFRLRVHDFPRQPASLSVKFHIDEESLNLPPY